MPTPTDRFELDTYDPGESWDHTDTVEFLDEIAVERDTVANRPTSGTYDGEIFFATDEEIFYQWDETNTEWNEVLNAPTQAEFEDHSTRHESGGSDELSVAGLSGDLADEQDAKPHDIGGATHNADTLANLNSKVSDATLDDANDTREPEAHSTTHESGGSDEISVDGLSGDLADAQDPKGHTTTHQSGGSDEIPLNGLELPAGSQIDEDGGDLVVRDSSGSIVLRRDEGAGAWDFVSGDLTGIASLEAASVNTGEASAANAPSQDDDVLRWQEGVEVGGVTADGLDNSGGDDNWGQSQSVRVGESFSNAFASTPVIATSLDNDRDNTSSDQYRHNIANKSATGFDVDFKQIAAVDNSGTTDAYGLSYVATEGR